MFDKTFNLAFATTCRHIEDGIALQPQKMEHTGDILDMETFPLNYEPNQEPEQGTSDNLVIPQIIDDGQHPQQNCRAPRQLSFDIHQADCEWNQVAHICQDKDLITACVMDTKMLTSQKHG
jgi:hypothetical protein